MPAGNVAQPARLQHGLQRRRLLRKLVALLDAVETDLRGLVEALVEADMGAERAVVIVRPCNGVGTVEDHVSVFP